MTIAATISKPPRIVRSDLHAPILSCDERAGLALRAGTTIEIDGVTHSFDIDTPVSYGDLQPGADYAIYLDGGKPFAATAAGNPIESRAAFAGFHFAPGGCAASRSGSDDVPAINPYSLWDIGFRPACEDPRGMAMVEANGRCFWVDIYLLGVRHAEKGTSRFGETIADGRSLPVLDYKSAVEIYAGHGKRLLTYDEFFTAASGVTERSSASRDPVSTGLDVARTSRFGLMQATGNLWSWGTDGDPDDPRPSIFGGSWLSGSHAGSRYATWTTGRSTRTGPLRARRQRPPEPCLGCAKAQSFLSIQPRNTIMTAAAELQRNTTRIRRADPLSSILFVAGTTDVVIKAGTTIEIDGAVHVFSVDTPVTLGELVPGRDYAVRVEVDGRPSATMVLFNPLDEGYVAGFHFAPGGNATGIGGGDDAPAINPYSLWDIGFRPACPDPRGMTIVDLDGGRSFWADIYLLGVDHNDHGTSRCGATIADGRDLPMRIAGTGKFGKLDYATAVEIYAHHGKRLLGSEEFFAAAYGVKERCSRDDEPTVTGALDEDGVHFISRRGLFDVTGTMWQWGTDGHPDDPRPSIFGGSWINGSSAGSRCAYLGCWPGVSSGSVSARGGSDHLNLA